MLEEQPIQMEVPGAICDEVTAMKNLRSKRDSRLRRARSRPGRSAMPSTIPAALEPD
jgi:hypothetical protein